MSESLTSKPPEDHQEIAAFLVAKVGELWAGHLDSSQYHTHPDYENLASKLLDSLACEFGPEAVTRATAGLLCYQYRPQELEWSKESHVWKEREKRLRIGFGAWLWQATYPSDLARDLFLEEFTWETENPYPQSLGGGIPLAIGVVDSWLGQKGCWLGSLVPPLRSAPDPRALEIIEAILWRGLFAWPNNESARASDYARYLVILKEAGRIDINLCRHVLNLVPGVVNYLDRGRALDPHLMEVVYEFAAVLNEENSHRFCYFRNPSGARWVIRACENVERLGLTTLSSHPADAYDRNHAIRKIAAIESFLPDDDLEAFKAELARYSPTTRRLLAACSPVARPYLLDDPVCALPAAFDGFKERFLSFNKEIHIYFDNSPDPANGVLPVAEFRRLADELGETGRAWMIEEFAQLGGQAEHAMLLLKGLFGIDRKKIEASISRSSQTAVKAYGLFALPEEEPARTNELIDRHARIKQFAQDAGKFKGGRRTNSLAAARAGLANLAQSAGFRSATDLEIRMMLSSGEAAEALPSMSSDSYDVRILLTTAGPKIEVSKLGRPQKSVPAALKKLPAFIALKDKLEVLEEQFRHFAEILEERMISELPIPAGEFAGMLKLPVSRWMIERLLLRSGDAMGTLDEGGTNLNDATHSHPIRGDVSIVHPVQISGEEISGWNRHFESRGLEATFPQLARETHAPDEQEAGLTGCQRFAGTKVDCTTTVRRLAGLGWTASKVDYPFFYKTYPAQGLRVALLPGDSIASFDSGDDFLIDEFRFSPSADHYFDHFSPMPLGTVAPVVFSEVVRDLNQFLGSQ